MPSSQDQNAQRSKQQRAYFGGRFDLEIDGVRQDLLVQSVDGGNFKSEAIGEKVGVQMLETRYPGRQKWEDITLTVGTAMSDHLWKWIEDSLDRDKGKPRRNGAIITYDADNCERDRREFTDALLAEVQFPMLDAKAKNPAYLTVKIAPEQMVWKKGDGHKSQPGSMTHQKLWVPANFRFRIDGFGDSLRWVQKIDQFSIKQNIITNPVGKELYVRKEAGRMEYPNITFHVAETYAEPWITYWKKFVGEGNHVESQEHTGSIEYLSPDLSEVLMTLSLSGLGITSVSFEKHEAGTEAVRFVRVECYTESIKLERGKGNV